MAVASCQRSLAQFEVTGTPSGPSLRAAEILKLAKSLHPPNVAPDAYPLVLRAVFGSPQQSANAGGLTAFEENRYFLDAVGWVSASDTSVHRDSGPATAARWTRRFLILKPATFVVDDEIALADARNPMVWRLYSRKPPHISGNKTSLSEEDGELTCETVLPQKGSQRLIHGPNHGLEPVDYSVEVSPSANAGAMPGLASVRFLHVLEAVEKGRAGAGVHVEVSGAADLCHLKISTQHRVFRLDLPRPSREAGNVAISAVDGASLISSRPLPAGILPHGPEGMRLLDQFDADYRGTRPPLWDAGQPSGELKKVVGDGTIRPSRAIELGSGSGTDAIYLASRGFEVTAIDIAPTALGQAQRKAQKAGVSVRWLLADVLALPDLEPFDFIYDRGCYHVVRDQSLAAYLEAVRRLSRPGTRFLLLAGNAQDAGTGYGLPRVAEEELRNDFLPLFDFEWMRQSRFEISQPGVAGPLAWSVLLRRKAEAEESKAHPSVGAKDD